MRLPIQTAAVVREATHRPFRDSSRAGSFPAPRSASINCGPDQEVCTCGANKFACCDPGQACHLDIDTNLCICGPA